MTQYAALLYYPEDNDWTAPENAPLMGEYGAFHQQAGAAITGGAALQPASVATTVTVQGGQGGDVLTSDGPYAEAREVLGGFYLLEAPDLDEAVRLASLCPAAWHPGGKVEVRPVVDMGG